jgi:hypothetical protein
MIPTIVSMGENLNNGCFKNCNARASLCKAPCNYTKQKQPGFYRVKEECIFACAFLTLQLQSANQCVSVTLELADCITAFAALLLRHKE